MQEIIKEMLEKLTYRFVKEGEIGNEVMKANYSVEVM